MNATATISPSRIADIVGAANVVADSELLAAYSVDGIAPQIAARPASAQEISELVKFAAAEKLAIIPAGARTKLGIGMPPCRYDLAIDMTRLDRVISYDPGDLTLSVEPGIPLRRLIEVLAEHNQFLPLAVPFSDRATVGGTLASGVDSPLRQFYGTARDFVLGMEFVSGDGALTKSGGRVVKNVSGYDLHKLFLGSVGSLGVITRINFKTFPLPRNTATFVAAFRGAHGASRFNQLVQQSTLRPQAVEVIDPGAARILNSAGSVAVPSHSEEVSWYVAVKIAGSDIVINRCHQELEQLARTAYRDSLSSFDKMPDAEGMRLWAAVREFPAAVERASTESAIFKTACLPADLTSHFEGIHSQAQRYSAEAAHVVRGVGACYWALFDTDRAKLRTLCREMLDHSANRIKAPVSILWCPSEWKGELNVWGPPREDFILHQRVKRAFDPHNIFAPGRFVGGL